MHAGLAHPAPRRLAFATPAIALVEAVILVSLGIFVAGGGLPGAGPAVPPAGSPSPSAPSPSPTPSDPSSPSATPSPPPSASPTPSPSPSPSPTPPPTVRPTPIATPTPTAKPTVRPTPTPPPASGPPRCEYLDVPTKHDAYSDWAITLLDPIYKLPSTYYPPDLVDTSSAGLNGGYLVRRLIVEDLKALARDARAAGVPVEVVSAFRSYAQQKKTFDYWVSVGGYEQALRTSARAGHSEHQLGTTVDLTSLGGADPWDYADWARTPAGAWVARNAWRYGFVMSYPPDSFAKTCYSYEPWHYRYVGRDLARRIVQSGLTPREVLWQLQ